MAALLLAPDAPAPMQVRSRNGRLTIHAAAVPLVQVLDVLTRETGLDVVFESAPPRQRVSADIEDAREPEALARLMEGTGVSYALRLSADGERVEMLMLFDTAHARPGSTTASTRPSQPALVPEPPPDEDEPPLFEPPPPEQPPSIAPESVPGLIGPGRVDPAVSAPVSPAQASFPLAPQSPQFPFVASFPR